MFQRYLVFTPTHIYAKLGIFFDFNLIFAFYFEKMDSFNLSSNEISSLNNLNI